MGKKVKRHHEDYWTKFLGGDIDHMRHSFIVDHYTYLEQIAKKLDIPFPVPATTFSNQIGLERWQVSTLANVVSQIEQKLGIKYKPQKPDLQTGYGQMQWGMENICKRIKAIEDKL